jgi:hypothetical protein
MVSGQRSENMCMRAPSRKVVSILCSVLLRFASSFVQLLILCSSLKRLLCSLPRFFASLLFVYCFPYPLGRLTDRLQVLQLVGSKAYTIMELLVTHCLPHLIGSMNKEKFYEIKILTTDISQFFIGNRQKKPFKVTKSCCRFSREEM